MGGVTNLLVSMAEDAANGKEFTAQLPNWKNATLMW
jgi:aspartokinase/homoserine dehydrogenase 1